MPPLVLAIEPDPRQAATIEHVVRERVRADFVVVDSKDAAIASIGARVPDLILVTALLPPRDEDDLTRHLKSLDRASHLQTLTIPLLSSDKIDEGEDEEETGRRLFGAFRRKKRRAPRIGGCDPTVFGEQIETYLQRAAELRAEQASHVDRVRDIEAPPVAEPFEPYTPAAAGPTSEDYGFRMYESARGVERTASGWESLREEQPAPVVPDVFDSLAAPHVDSPAPAEIADTVVAPREPALVDHAIETEFTSAVDELTATVQALGQDAEPEHETPLAAAETFDTLPEPVALEPADVQSDSTLNAPTPPTEQTAVGDMSYEQMPVADAEATAELAAREDAPTADSETVAREEVAVAGTEFVSREAVPVADTEPVAREDVAEADTELVAPAIERPMEVAAVENATYEDTPAVAAYQPPSPLDAPPEPLTVSAIEEPAPAVDAGAQPTGQAVVADAVHEEAHPLAASAFDSLPELLPASAVEPDFVLALDAPAASVDPFAIGDAEIASVVDDPFEGIARVREEKIRHAFRLTPPTPYETPAATAAEPDVTEAVQRDVSEQLPLETFEQEPVEAPRAVTGGPSRVRHASGIVHSAVLRALAPLHAFAARVAASRAAAPAPDVVAEPVEPELPSEDAAVAVAAVDQAPLDEPDADAHVETPLPQMEAPASAEAVQAAPADDVAAAAPAAARASEPEADRWVDITPLISAPESNRAVPADATATGPEREPVTAEEQQEAAEPGAAKAGAEKKRRRKRRKRSRSPLSDLETPLAGLDGHWVASAIAALRVDIERLRQDALAPAGSQASGDGTEARQSNRSGAGGNGNGHGNSNGNGHGQQPPAAADGGPVQDEWGFFNPERCGMQALMARLDEQDKTAQEAGGPPPSRPMRELVANYEQTRKTRPPELHTPADDRRFAPLAMWARAGDAVERVIEDSIPLLETTRPRSVMAGLLLPEQVSAVRYGSGCRIHRVRVAPSAEKLPATGKRQVIILSRKALKELA